MSHPQLPTRNTTSSRAYSLMRNWHSKEKRRPAFSKDRSVSMIRRCQSFACSRWYQATREFGRRFVSFVQCLGIGLIVTVLLWTLVMVFGQALEQWGKG